jgi:ABC-type glutathione transport system ATPase component
MRWLLSEAVSLLHAGQIKDNEHVATISKNFKKKIQYHLKSSKAKDINKKKKKQCQAISEKGHQNMLVLQLNKKNPYKQ